MSCVLCGKPPSPYPNWLLSHGQSYHVGCLTEAYQEIKVAHRRLFDKLVASGFYGPWSDDFEGSYEQRMDGRLVAVVGHNGDARLIAKAPEMYDALRRLTDEMQAASSGGEPVNADWLDRRIKRTRTLLRAIEEASSTPKTTKRGSPDDRL